MPAAAATNIRSMSLPPDQMPLSKPKLTPEKRRRRAADRLRIIRLRMAIGRELDERSIITPAEIGAALGMPAAEATKLLYPTSMAGRRGGAARGCGGTVGSAGTRPIERRCL